MTHCDSANVIATDPKAAAYTLCGTQWAPTMGYKDDLFGTAGDFAKLFEATYGYAPPYQAAESAAAVEVFANAFERAGTLDKEAVRDAIAATDMQTFYGNIKFDDTGKNTAKPMAHLPSAGRRVQGRGAEQVCRDGSGHSKADVELTCVVRDTGRRRRSAPARHVLLGMPAPRPVRPEDAC